MIDNHFRNLIPRYINFIMRIFAILRLTPNQITVAAFLLSIVSAYLVYLGYFILAIGIWWLSRLLDACDGIYARKYNMTSLFGAYLDIQLDMAAYSLIVIALLFKFPQFYVQWVLMLFFYILCVTGALSLGLFQSKVGKEDKSGRGLRLAAGLAEGGETGIAYTLFLLLPSWLYITTWIWVAVLLVTVMARMGLAYYDFKNYESVLK